jgi:hypothetical protein
MFDKLCHFGIASKFNFNSAKGFEYSSSRCYNILFSIPFIVQLCGMAIYLSRELELNGSMFCIGDGCMLYFLECTPS